MEPSPLAIGAVQLIANPATLTSAYPRKDPRHEKPRLSSTDTHMTQASLSMNSMQPPQSPAAYKGTHPSQAAFADAAYAEQSGSADTARWGVLPGGLPNGGQPVRASQQPQSRAQSASGYRGVSPGLTGSHEGALGSPHSAAALPGAGSGGSGKMSNAGSARRGGGTVLKVRQVPGASKSFFKMPIPSRRGHPEHCPHGRFQPAPHVV